MKKIGILLTATASVAVMASSCTSNPKANLKTDVDSLSYAFGANYTDGLIPYLEQRGVDSTLLNDFIRGWLEGASVKADDKKKSAYLVGVEVGHMVGSQWFEGANQQIFAGDSTASLSKENFLAGFIEAVTNRDVKMDLMTAQGYVTTKSQEIQTRQMETAYGANREEGVKFLEDNGKNDDVTVLASGLQYKVLTRGSGPLPSPESTVRVHYHGTLIDGTVFDSSVERGTPAEFPVGGVISGWTEALQLMPVGSKWMLYIPQELAYGERDMGTIKPFSTLIFEVELLEILR